MQAAPWIDLIIIGCEESGALLPRSDDSTKYLH